MRINSKRRRERSSLRLAGEHDLETLQALASAISSVADFLQPASAERLCTLLVSRLEEEQDPGKLLYLAVAMESMADETRGSGSASLAQRLIRRMQKEQSPHELKSLAFSVAAFENSGVSMVPAEELVLSRMSSTSSADDLRTLTSAMYALREKAADASFEKAASILAGQIQSQLDPNAIRTLATSMHALAMKAGPEPYERAASAIVRNPKGLAMLEPALGHVASKIGPAKAEELAGILERRIASEKDPAEPARPRPRAGRSAGWGAASGPRTDPRYPAGAM